jgi:hypothetical protein
LMSEFTFLCEQCLQQQFSVIMLMSFKSVLLIKTSHVSNWLQILFGPYKVDANNQAQIFHNLDSYKRNPI